jgi:hypothetical protein
MKARRLGKERRFLDCHRASRVFEAYRSFILHDSPLVAVSAGWQSADGIRLEAAFTPNGGHRCADVSYVPTTQFGLRFSLKAAMPSRASADSRASR